MLSEPGKGSGAAQAVAEVLAAEDRWDFEAACRLAQEAVAEHLESAAAQAVHAHFLLWRGRREEAHAALERALSLDPDCALARAAEADVAAFEARYDAAREAASRALALDGEDPWVLQRCANAYQALGDAGTAEALLQRWVSLRPDEESPLAARITHLAAAGRFPEAERVLQEAEARFPDSPRFWFHRARVLMRGTRLIEAAELLQRVSERLPGSAMVWAELAQALSFVKRADEAEAAARRALEIGPCTAVAMLALGRVCRQRGEVEAAADWEARAAEAIPALRVHRFLTQANAALRQGEWAKALELVEGALNAPMHGTHYTALSLKARALLALRRHTEASRVLSELQQAGDLSPNWFELSARVRKAQGDLGGAAAVLRDGIGAYPSQGVLRSEMLRVLHAQGREEEETAAIADAFAHFPEMPAGVAALFMALVDTGHRAEAREMKRLGQERFPEAGELRLFEALDRLRRGDVAGARECAEDVAGEWEDAAQKVTRAADTISRLRRMVAQLRMRRPGSDEPPTLH